MKQRHRTPRCAALLLSVAALPLTPLAAQTTDTTAPPADVSPPPPTETVQTPTTQVAPAPEPTTEPVVTTAPAADEAPAPDTSSAAPPPARTTRATPRPRSPARATVREPARTIISAPAPVRAEVTPVAPPEAQTVAETATTALPPPPPVAIPPEVLPEPQSPLMAMLPWLIAGLLLLGGLAFLLMRRRRRAVLREATLYEEPTPSMAPEPLMAAPLATEASAAGLTGGIPAEAPTDEPKVLNRGIEQPAGFAAGFAAAPGAIRVANGDRPILDLTMRPLRAGVSNEDARVDFELTVGNNGTAAARDIRISAWMFPAGSESSDMERMLIEHGTETTVSEVDAGDTRRIESTVALPTDRLAQDSVLPVVVAEARYRLQDGSEARTSARFAVGVPVGEQLAHFDLENPSGLHEDVEARPLDTA